MAVIMLAWPSSCWHGRHHVGMAVIMLAWSDSCLYCSWHVGRHYIGMVVIMLACWRDQTAAYSAAACLFLQ